MSDPIYKIIDWNIHFENNRSRSVENLRWVCVPNRHDGEGYSLIMEQDDAAELFAAWVLILQVASKCQVRGSLVRNDGTPLTAESLSIKTRADKAWFEKALNFFTHKVKWLDCQPTVRQVSADCQAGDTQVTKKEGKQKKGIEGKASKARPQSREAFDAYFREVGLYPRDAEATWNKWEGNGWSNGGKKIVCWKSTVLAWKASAYMPSQKSPSDYEPEWPRPKSEAKPIDDDDDLMAKVIRLREEEHRLAMGDHPDYWTENPKRQTEDEPCF